MSEDPQEPRWSKEQIDKFIKAVDKLEKRRKIMLTGYLVALVVMVVGQVGAFYVYGTSPPGQFVGWVFLLPFGLVGSVLWLFGRWAERIK